MPLASEFGFDDESINTEPVQNDDRPTGEAVGTDSEKSVIEFASRRKSNKESLEDEMARLDQTRCQRVF